MSRIVPFAFAALVTSLLAGCSPGELGTECTPSTESNPCAEGLTCLTTEEPQPNAAGELECVEAGSFCTLPCQDDADCAELGEGLICVNDCGGACFVGSRG